MSSDKLAFLNVIRGETEPSTDWMKIKRAVIIKTTFLLVCSCLSLFFLSLNNDAYAQFPPSTDNTPICGVNVCCPPGTGDPGTDCESAFCPPTDSGECDPSVSSCVVDPQPCTGTDCGNNDCAELTESDGTSVPSGAQATQTQNPINLISGNKYKRQVDLAPLPGVLGLRFVRHYNSLLSGNLGIGSGWRHTYSVGLSIGAGFKPGEQESIKLQQADGRIIQFARMGERKIGAQYATRNHSDGFMTTTDYGYQWRWRSGRKLSFDERGLLTQIEQGQHRLSLDYNASGHLVRVIDPQGRRLTFQYYDKLLTHITDPAGNKTEYRYTYDMELLQVIRPSGKSRKYHYQDETRGWYLTGITDERNIRVENYGYDAEGRANHSSKGLAVDKVTIEYDDENGRRIVTNGLGEQTINILGEVNGQQVIKEVRGPGCSACSTGDVAYEYNDALQVTKVSYKSGLVLEYEYDDRGRTTAQYRSASDQAKQLISAFEYKGHSHQPNVVKRPSIKPNDYLVTQLEYTDGGNILSGTTQGFTQRGNGQFEAINRQVKFSYDNLGRMIAMDGPRNDVDDITHIVWNNDNLMSQITTPDGTVQRFLAYDKTGRIQQLQVNEQTPLTLSYTTTGKIASVKPLHQAAEFNKGASDVATNQAVEFLYHYDANDNLVQISAPHDISINYLYDDYNRLIRRDNGIHKTEYQWSVESLLLTKTTTDAQEHILSSQHYTYDAEDRLLAIQDANGNVLQSRAYDSLTTIVTAGAGGSTIDDAANNSQYQHDGFGDLAQLLRHQTQTQFTQINGAALITSFTDAENGQTTFAYDDFGATSYVNSPDSGLTEYFRDTAGMVTRKRNAQQQTVDFQYDQRGQFKQIVYAGDRINVQDKPQQRIQTQQNQTAEDYQYQDNRLSIFTRDISLKSSNDIYQYSTQYTYDKQGRLINKTLPGGQDLRYTYHQDGDNQGTLKSLVIDGLLFDDVIIDDITIRQEEQGNSDSASKQAVQHRDVTYTHGNGTQTAFHRDHYQGGRGFLRKLVHRGDKIGQQEYGYLYNTKAQIIGIDENQRPYHRYRYNAKQELDFAMTPHALYGYAYDDNNNRTVTAINGNRIEMDYAQDSNRLTQMRAGELDLPIKYRADGSIIELGKLRFDYNENGQPAKVYQTDTEQLIAEYDYNSRAERISKTVFIDGKAQQTFYLYENRQLVAETDNQGRVKKQYLYAGVRPIAMLVEDDVYAVHSNHLGAPLMVSDEDGEMVWQAAYAPFGQALVNSDPDGDGEAFEFNIRLPGQYEDKETRLYYNYYRYYEPITGRYLSSDPLGLNAGPNTYAYVKNDPVHYTDPLGLLLFAFDGTGNSDPAQAGSTLSNVVHFRDAYQADVNEYPNQHGSNVFYVAGVGTQDTRTGRWSDDDTRDSATGYTIPERVDQMATYLLEYVEFMQNNQVSGQTINLDITGFSRGAATARVFANVIERLFVQRDYNALNSYSRETRAPDFTERLNDAFEYIDCSLIDFNFRFMGIFDTVPHYYLPQNNDLDELPLGIPSSFDRVSHAVAVNENRSDFNAISIHDTANGGQGNRVERGFLGAHSDIGGGYSDGDLSDVAFMWMMNQARASGVSIDNNLISNRDLDEVTNPIVHDSLDIFPFINADRDFRYLDGSFTDQAGNTSPGDSIADSLFGQDTWNANGAYGINAERAEGMFDDSFMETIQNCPRCAPITLKGEDATGARTRVGAINLTNASGLTYQQWLANNYGLQITIDHSDLSTPN